MSFNRCLFYPYFMCLDRNFVAFGDSSFFRKFIFLILRSFAKYFFIRSFIVFFLNVFSFTILIEIFVIFFVHRFIEIRFSFLGFAFSFCMFLLLCWLFFQRFWIKHIVNFVIKVWWKFFPTQLVWNHINVLTIFSFEILIHLFLSNVNI